MEAVFCSDKAGLRQFAVSATSLAIHRPADMTQAFLLSVDVKPSDVAKLFETLYTRWGLRWELIQIPEEVFSVFPVFGHVTLGTYFRLMIGEVLPEDSTEVLYLDTDIVIHQPIDELIASAMSGLGASGRIVAAVPEESAATKHLHTAGILDGPYLQAGVMLINLPRWREALSLEHFVNLLARHKKDIVWWDQDILNIALKDRWLELPRILNGTPGTRTSDTVVYHYAGNQKPWKYKASVEDIEIYEHYRQLTPVLRPRRTDPKTVFDHYTKPYRTAKKIIKKKLGIRTKKRTPS
jgi:lipopolysaccharide biosynthesis glycosyltransferase